MKADRLAFVTLLMLLHACSSGSKRDTVQDSLTTVADLVMEDAPEELHDADYGIYHYSITVHPGMSPLALVYHTPDRKYYVYGNSDESGKPLMAIPFSSNINYDDGEYAEYPESTFAIHDFNFDGNRDLSVISNTGAANIWSDIYLYDPGKMTFVKNDFLSDKSTLEVDSVHQLLKYYDNGGMAGGWYTSGVIQWKKGVPQLIHLEEQTSDPEVEDLFTRTVSVPGPDGKMVVACVVEITSSLPNYKEGQCLKQEEWTEFDKFPHLMFANDMKEVLRADGRTQSCWGDN